VPGDAGEHPDDLRQDPFEAEAAIRQLVDLGYMAALPEDAQARLDLVRRETVFNLGVVHLTRGRANAAVAALEPLVVEVSETRYGAALARAHLAAARPERACDTLASIRNADPDHKEARLLHASALASAGRAREAREVLRPLLSNNSGVPSCTLGDLCLAAGDINEAERSYQRALAAAPADPAALVGLARVELARDRFEPAAERCLDALEHSPGLAEANHVLAVSLAWLGEHDDASQAFETVLALQPGRVEARLFLAALHDQAGRAAAAAEQRAAVDAMFTTQGFDADQRRRTTRETAHGPDAWARREAGADAV
jgi:tetratricopeptide (TPR) repeat protein